MSLLTATTTISLVLVVIFILYTVKKRCLTLRKTSTQNYDVPEVITIGSIYETIQRQKTLEELETNPATEYMEIAAISSEYINLN